MPTLDSHARERDNRDVPDRGAPRRAPAPEQNHGRVVGAIAAGRTTAIDPASVGRLQRFAGNAVVARAAAKDEKSAAVEAVKGGGSPLPDAVRTSMEEKFGTDFSAVRIHTGPSAAAANQELGAKAYTLGSDIAFDAGSYDPDSGEGKRLLAHELTHVVQQQQGRVEGTEAPGGIAVSHPEDTDEKEAEETAQRAVRN